MAARAQSTVTSVSPANASHIAPVSTDVSATLSDAEDSGLSAQTFVVHGSQTPTGANTTSGAGTTTITVDPVNDFQPGEQVQATVTDGIQTKAGSVVPHVWTFLTQVTGGTGLFIQSANSLGESSSISVRLGDVDGDGHLDAVVANYGEPTSTVWVNSGSGTFTQYGSTYNGNDIDLGDLDGDGDLDVFSAVRNDANRVTLNGGSGLWFASSNSLGSSASQGLDLGDVDGDGDLDAFVANGGFEPNRVWFNSGSGSFSENSLNQLGTSYSLDIALGDIDGDGDLDAFVANFNGPNRVWLNAGSGTFSQSANSLGGYHSSDVSLGDVDGDGDLDAFVVNFDYEPNQVWLNAGNGTFTQSGNSLGGSSSVGVSLGDLDGDGDLDAFVANDGQANRVWVNGGSGTFTQSANSLGDSSSNDVSLGDVDGDGNLDAFVANAASQPNRVWLNADDSDNDRIADINDNCPDDPNTDQLDQDNDGLGNVCDDDVDGDGQNNDVDDDDDGDGLLDEDEPAVGADPLDPDTDDDGVVDGLDRDPDDASNVLDNCVSPDAVLNLEIMGTRTCAATDSITTISPAKVEGTGDLLMIAPQVSFGDGFSVDSGGELHVISEDPTATEP